MAGSNNLKRLKLYVERVPLTYYMSHDLNKALYDYIGRLLFYIGPWIKNTNYAKYTSLP